MTDEREIAKLFRVPEALVGIPAPWYRRWIQRFITRRP